MGTCESRRRSRRYTSCQNHRRRLDRSRERRCLGRTVQDAWSLRLCCCRRSAARSKGRSPSRRRSVGEAHRSPPSAARATRKSSATAVAGEISSSRHVGSHCSKRPAPTSSSGPLSAGGQRPRGARGAARAHVRCLGGRGRARGRPLRRHRLAGGEHEAVQCEGKKTVCWRASGGDATTAGFGPCPKDATFQPPLHCGGVWFVVCGVHVVNERHGWMVATCAAPAAPASCRPLTAGDAVLLFLLTITPPPP
jgi:hypothetical protein